MVQPGDMVIIIAYGIFTEADAANFSPNLVFVDKDNKIVDIANNEVHGDIR